jgi:hypothetical protein
VTPRPSRPEPFLTRKSDLERADRRRTRPTSGRSSRSMLSRAAAPAPFTGFSARTPAHCASPMPPILARGTDNFEPDGALRAPHGVDHPVARRPAPLQGGHNTRSPPPSRAPTNPAPPSTVS